MDNIIINGDITNATIKEYLRAKTIESLANAYNQTTSLPLVRQNIHIALQKVIANDKTEP
jgi:hypothetical protein